LSPDQLSDVIAELMQKTDGLILFQLCRQFSNKRLNVLIAQTS